MVYGFILNESDLSNLLSIERLCCSFNPLLDLLVALFDQVPMVQIIAGCEAYSHECLFGHSLYLLVPRVYAFLFILPLLIYREHEVLKVSPRDEDLEASDFDAHDKDWVCSQPDTRIELELLVGTVLEIASYREICRMIVLLPLSCRVG